MIRHDVPVCECDVCGHQWLAEKGKTPDRCPSRKCRSVAWNQLPKVKTAKASDIRFEPQEIQVRPSANQCEKCGGLNGLHQKGCKR